MIEVKADDLAFITLTLRTHLPEYKVFAFGSRVRGTARPCSDLDLFVKGAEPVGWDRLERIREIFSESDLPFRVDLVDWQAIDETFREVLRRSPQLVLTSPEDGAPEERQGSHGSHR